MSQPNFPSQNIIDRIDRLDKVNASPSQFQSMAAEEIAEEIVTNLGGDITIDVSKTPEAERIPIREAVNVEVRRKKPIITILGDNGGFSVDEGFTEEDQILRAINREILDDGNEVNIGRIAFRRFIQTLLGYPGNHQLVRDEWNRFIVGHAETGNVDTPYESHHFPNVGLTRRSGGISTLTEQQIGFIKGIMEEFRGQVARLFEDDPDILQHAKPGMNTLDARLLAIGEAEWSNFVRGAGYHRYRRGEGSLDGYAPRRLAADIIDKVEAEAEAEARAKAGAGAERVEA